MGVGVVDVHDTNMGFKPPCHFVIVHMKLSYLLVILGAYLMDCICTLLKVWALFPWYRRSPKAWVLVC